MSEHPPDPALISTVAEPPRIVGLVEQDHLKPAPISIVPGGVRGRGHDSSRSATRTQNRAISTGSTRSPERDRFLESVGALRDWLKDIGRDATWRVALTSVFGLVSTQISLPNETVLARTLLFVSAVTLGALVGRRLDRRKRRKPLRR